MRSAEAARSFGIAPRYGVAGHFVIPSLSRSLANVRERLLLFAMRFRTYKNTDLKVSEVGFGLWTISTGWWGDFTQSEAIALMRKAFDLGMTLFDAADTYGNGLSEELSRRLSLTSAMKSSSRPR